MVQYTGLDNILIWGYICLVTALVYVFVSLYYFERVKLLHCLKNQQDKSNKRSDTEKETDKNSERRIMNTGVEQCRSDSVNSKSGNSSNDEFSYGIHK